MIVCCVCLSLLLAVVVWCSLFDACCLMFPVCCFCCWLFVVACFFVMCVSCVCSRRCLFLFVVNVLSYASLLFVCLMVVVVCCGCVLLIARRSRLRVVCVVVACCGLWLIPFCFVLCVVVRMILFVVGFLITGVRVVGICVVATFGCSLLLYSVCVFVVVCCGC